MSLTPEHRQHLSESMKQVHKEGRAGVGGRKPGMRGPDGNLIEPGEATPDGVFNLPKSFLRTEQALAFSYLDHGDVRVWHYHEPVAYLITPERYAQLTQQAGGDAQ